MRITIQRRRYFNRAKRHPINCSRLATMSRLDKLIFYSFFGAGMFGAWMIMAAVAILSMGGTLW